MTALAKALPYNSEHSYRHMTRMNEIAMPRNVHKFPVTESPAIDCRRDCLKFSRSVHRRFWWSVLLVLLSGSVSLAGVIAENDVASMSGVTLLALGLFAIMGWATKAHDERQAQLG